MEQILIVDDDRAARTALRKRFSHSGYETLVAASGRAAIDEFNRHRPQVIILDAAMPDMSGFDVCREVRLLDPLRRTRIYFLTGASTPSADYVARCVAASDADGYLRKPYDVSELMALVRKAFVPDDVAEVL